MTALPKNPVGFTRNAVPFAIRAERATDVVAREALLDACFGANRDMRTCERLRDGRAPAEGLALSAVRQGKLVGTVRLWHVSAGGVPALMLGPLAVDGRCRGLGIGAALDGSRPVRCQATRPWRGDPARRRALLRPLRLRAGCDRRTVAARAVRARSPARPGTAPRRARRRARDDLANRRRGVKSSGSPSGAARGLNRVAGLATAPGVTSRLPCDSEGCIRCISLD